MYTTITSSPLNFPSSALDESSLSNTPTTEQQQDNNNVNIDNNININTSNTTDISTSPALLPTTTLIKKPKIKVRMLGSKLNSGSTSPTKPFKNSTAQSHPKRIYVTENLPVFQRQQPCRIISNRSIHFMQRNVVSAKKTSEELYPTKAITIPAMSELADPLYFDITQTSMKKQANQTARTLNNTLNNNANSNYNSSSVMRKLERMATVPKLCTANIMGGGSSTNRTEKYSSRSTGRTGRSARSSTTSNRCTRATLTPKSSHFSHSLMVDVPMIDKQLQDQILLTSRSNMSSHSINNNNQLTEKMRILADIPTSAKSFERRAQRPTTAIANRKGMNSYEKELTLNYEEYTFPPTNNATNSRPLSSKTTTNHSNNNNNNNNSKQLLQQQQVEEYEEYFPTNHAVNVNTNFEDANKESLVQAGKMKQSDILELTFLIDDEIEKAQNDIFKEDAFIPLNAAVDLLDMHPLERRKNRLENKIQLPTLGISMIVQNDECSQYNLYANAVDHKKFIQPYVTKSKKNKRKKKKSKTAAATDAENATATIPSSVEATLETEVQEIMRLRQLQDTPSMSQLPITTRTASSGDAAVVTEANATEVKVEAEETNEGEEEIGEDDEEENEAVDEDGAYINKQLETKEPAPASVVESNERQQEIPIVTKVLNQVQEPYLNYLYRKVLACARQNQ